MDSAKRFTYDAISAVGRAGAPSVLITVRSVENPPFLGEISVHRSIYEKRHRSRKKGILNTYESSGVLAYKVGHRNYRLHTMEACGEQAIPTCGGNMVLYLSNSCTSKTTVGGPLELCDTFLFGGTDSTPDRSHVLTAATGVGLQTAGT